MGSTDVFPVDPHYPIQTQLVSGVLRSPALSKKRSQVQTAPNQRIFTLTFDLLIDEMEQVRDFIARFADSYFIFNHKEWRDNAGTLITRRFAVELLDAELPQGDLVRFKNYQCSLRLLEAVGQEMDKNYLTFGDRFENAVWSGNASGVANPTVTPDTVADPRGNRTADSIAFPTTAGGQFSEWIQSLSGLSELRGKNFTFRIWMKAASNTTIQLEIKDNPYSSTFVSTSMNVTTSWQLFSVSAAVPASASDTGIVVAILQPASQAAKTIQVWHAHLGITGAAEYPDPRDGHATRFIEETGGVVIAGTWSRTLAGHGGTRKDNNNLNTTDAFQWTYSGYGFALWGTRWDNLGRADLYLDGALLGRIEYYSSDLVDNVPLFEKWDVPLGLHRVKLKATNTKNASSSANTINADALEVVD